MVRPVREDNCADFQRDFCTRQEIPQYPRSYTSIDKTFFDGISTTKHTLSCNIKKCSLFTDSPN